MSWFYDILDTKDGETIYVNVFPFEEESKIYEEALMQRCIQNQTTNEKIKALLERKIGFSHKETQLVKLSLLLSDWITPQTTLDLEKKFFCRSDQIGKRASWLLDAACGIARVLKSDKKLVNFLKNLSQEVNFGVDQRGLRLAKLRVPGLGRDYIWNLAQNGFFDLKKIKEAEISDLERFIPTRVAERLKEKIQNSRFNICPEKA